MQLGPGGHLPFVARIVEFGGNVFISRLGGARALNDRE